VGGVKCVVNDLTLVIVLNVVLEFVMLFWSFATLYATIGSTSRRSVVSGTREVDDAIEESRSSTVENINQRYRELSQPGLLHLTQSVG
jgi:hypothetical protein